MLAEHFRQNPGVALLQELETKNMGQCRGDILRAAGIGLPTGVDLLAHKDNRYMPIVIVRGPVAPAAGFQVQVDVAFSLPCGGKLLAKCGMK